VYPGFNLDSEGTWEKRLADGHCEIEIFEVSESLTSYFFRLKSLNPFNKFSKNDVPLGNSKN